MLGNNTGRSQASLSWDHGKRSSLVAASLSWDHGKRIAAAAMTLFMAAALLLPVNATAASADEPLVSVIVRQVEGSSTAASSIDGLGGEITANLETINAFVADVPNGALDLLASLPGVASVTQNFSVTLHGAGWDNRTEAATMEKITHGLGANASWYEGVTGDGVTIAMIDTGLTPVDGLATSGKVVNGADLSFDSQTGTLYTDGYGHGTHLAGIMAGRSNGSPTTITSKDVKDHFFGIAPDAQVLNMKVGAADGAVDISQVLASIDWVVQHRNDSGMNVRVLNLSFGTDSTQNYTVDPLAFAVELAWNNGIVVVVASGNDGSSSYMRNPATDPYVIAVGAADDLQNNKQNDDTYASFSNCGSSGRHVDVLAPGVSVLSLLAPGSEAATQTDAMIDGMIRGSGTSQAAAVVSGAAALILDKYPNYTPDQVKALLMQTASPINGSTQCQGEGVIDIKEAMKASTMPASTQSYHPSNGSGLLEAARGSVHVANDLGVDLVGEFDIMLNPWIGWGSNSWSTTLWSGNSWSGNSWSGNSWSGNSWSGNSWSGNSWSANSWSGNSWSGNSWSSNSWGANSWGGNTWSGNSWN